MSKIDQTLPNEKLSSKSLVSYERPLSRADKSESRIKKITQNSIFDQKRYKNNNFYPSDYYSSIMMNNHSNSSQYRNKIDPITYREIYGYEKFRSHFIKKQMQYRKEQKIVLTDNRPEFNLSLSTTRNIAPLKYNPQMDEHQRSYFLDGRVRQRLVRQNLITNDGEIVEQKGLTHLNAVKYESSPKLTNVKRLKDLHGDPKLKSYRIIKPLVKRGKNNPLFQSVNVSKTPKIDQKLNITRLGKSDHLDFLEKVKAEYKLNL